MQEIYFATSSTSEAETDRVLKIKYGNNYKSVTRKTEIPKPGFCVKNEVDPSALSSPKRYAKHLSRHSYSHPDKKHNFQLVGLVKPSMFKKFF